MAGAKQSCWRATGSTEQNTKQTVKLITGGYGDINQVQTSSSSSWPPIHTTHGSCTLNSDCLLGILKGAWALKPNPVINSVPIGSFNSLSPSFSFFIRWL